MESDSRISVLSTDFMIYESFCSVGDFYDDYDY